MPIPRPSSPPSYTTFRASSLLPNLPTLLPASLVSTWPAFTLFSLSSSLSSSPITAHNCLDGSSTHSTLGALLGAWEKGEGEDLYLKDWHLPLLLLRAGKRVEELYEVPQLWRDDWMNGYYCAETEDDFRFVYMGGGRTFTLLHRDVYCSYSISTNLVGAKLWTLFPPLCTTRLVELLKEAERRDELVDVRTWSEGLRLEFVEMGMVEVRQEEGESIFIPSGWYHQVQNLSHPTISLNHNWCNAHNLHRMYASMCTEVTAVRASIEDVREMLVRKGVGWEEEWEECVGELLERSAGWNWTTFWRMVRYALRAIDPVERAVEESSWPLTPPQARPPTTFILEQVRPLLMVFRARSEEEWKWTMGMKELLEEVESEMRRLG